MIFTDRDLEQLQSVLDCSPWPPEIGEPKLRAILSRLKAAEDLLEAGEAICDPATYSWLKSKWHKASGRSE